MPAKVTRIANPVDQVLEQRKKHKKKTERKH